jgi:hypothetical protein
MKNCTDTADLLALPTNLPADIPPAATPKPDEETEADDESQFWRNLADDERVAPFSDEIAVYLNVSGNVVFRRPARDDEESDPFMVLGAPYVDRLIKRLQGLKQAS